MVTRWTVIGILAASSLMPASRASGNEKKHKVIQDSVEALRALDPDLSSRLERFADDKAQGKGKKASVSAGDVRLIRDSAAALRATRPELARELESIADKKARKAKGAAGRGETDSPADETNSPPARPGY